MLRAISEIAVASSVWSVLGMSRPIASERARWRAVTTSASDSIAIRSAGSSAKVTRHRSRGIIVDVTSLDVMDSFVSRSLRGIAHMTRLRGAETVIVGIQPEVAFAMVQLGMQFEDVQTALDLEEGLALLQYQLKEPLDGGG